MENENQYKILSEKLKKIKKEIFEQSKLKFPSHHTLENSASEIIQLLKNIKISDADFEEWSSWKVINMNIFIADLVGELHHDYDKRLVRYYNKWRIEKEKIDKLILDFTTKFSDRIE